MSAAHFLVKNGDRIPNIEYKEIASYTRNIRRIVVFILDAHKKLKFDLHATDIVSEILSKLKDSDDIRHYGVAKKVEEILDMDTDVGQTETKKIVMKRIDELNTLLSFDPATSLPNRTKCVRDVESMEEC